MTTIGSFFTVASCVANLPSKFNNRQNLYNFSDPPGWPTNINPPVYATPVQAVIEAVTELTETYEFEELKYQTPVPSLTPLNLTAGNPVVPISTLLGTIPTNAALYPQFQNQNLIDITDVYTFWMWFAGGVNQAGRVLKYRRVPTIDMYSYGITNNNQNQLGVAPPTYFSRFGINLQVGPVPDQNYQYFVRMKLRHPFPVGGSSNFIAASMTASIAAGVVTGVTIVNGGQGYQASVTIPLWFTPSPNGSVATGTVTTNVSGVVTSFAITNGGTGYVTAPTVASAAVAGQQIFMPSSWQEIVELCACQRIALWEGASEYIELFEELLKTKGIDIAAARARRAQMVRDELHNERMISLMVGPYTYA
jgi:hypothetical protein